jgi:chromosome segregation protein
VKFSRLRLTGFKSFVESTELPIEPGLTGIVGPNGCGKSNLLEALRWVMGENSAKSMRGGAMDDVIFSGTNNRPGRNTAEVSLIIDNGNRTAPSQYNDTEALEISRRIEREMGSIYKINGRDVRARDVQIFFADASSGAHSPALVKQGQIGQLISAKPIARRAILEEAAGISGLHARRHEAELKLNAAQTNLSRVADIIQEIELQLANLKRQARQAARYRNLSGHIQRADALALYVRLQFASTAAEAAEIELNRIRSEVEDLTLRSARASNGVLEADEKLPALRQVAAERSAALQRLTAERMALDGEEARAKAAAERLSARLAQIFEDQARETARVDDARRTMLTLEQERTELDAASQGEMQAAEAALAALEAAQSVMASVENSSDKSSTELGDAKAQRTDLERRIESSQRVSTRLRTELDGISSEIERLAREADTAPHVEQAQLRITASATAADSAKSTHRYAEEGLRAARDGESARKKTADTTERELVRLKAEARALTETLSAGIAQGFTPVIDLLQVTPGFEAALGAALGDDLNVPLDENAPVYWRALHGQDELPGLPPDAQSLAGLVNAPDALARRISQIGVVDRDKGKTVQSSLLPGQCLVSREGDLWRWDGFTVTAEAPTAAAVRLRQRNRLADLEGTVASAEVHLSDLQGAWHDAKEAREAAELAERTLRTARRDADAEAGAARTALAEAEKRHAQTAARTQSLSERHVALSADEAESAALESQLRSEFDLLPLLAEFESALAATREALTEARAGYAHAKAVHDGAEREARARQQRLQIIVADLDAWNARISTADGQIKALQLREGEARTELQALEHLPAEIAEKRTRLFEILEEAEAARSAANDALALSEGALKAAQSESRAADQALSHAREERARCDAVLSAQRERVQEAITRARDTLDCAPDELASRAEYTPGDELPTLDAAEQRSEKLKREREQLGGVNLRAEEEAEECETRLTTLQSEKNDLEAAITRLRQGIGSLNREGRERLLEAFDRVNANFQKLFISLFTGGEARLTLTESDDPLEAGLEILARPPGKKLQTMSLLSGGEQALTAMAMIFAVFLCNPAPVCVLDEVDAPLDDANVERFCNLLDEITRMTETRFLVITHHALTMSRMDRLLGVTMQERGVSQLVSVDLAGAERVLQAQAAE